MSDLPVPLHVVPTLTEVVEPGYLAPAMAPLPPTPLHAATRADTPRPEALSAAQEEELVVQRVLQRVDRLLEQRLQEAMGQLIMAHTQALMPRLRQEVELVVRESVVQAFEQEIVSSSTRP